MQVKQFSGRMALLTLALTVFAAVLLGARYMADGEAPREGTPLTQWLSTLFAEGHGGNEDSDICIADATTFVQIKQPDICALDSSESKSGFVDKLSSACVDASALVQAALSRKFTASSRTPLKPTYQNLMEARQEPGSSHFLHRQWFRSY